MAKINRKIRRSQLISPWGVGAIIPFPNEESLIVSGIDGWKNDDPKYIIKDERLAKRLRVNQLRWPPEYVEPSAQNFVDDNKNRFIDAYRFPGWFYCPLCGHMEKVSLYSVSNKRECDHHWYHDELIERLGKMPLKCAMVPERFVVVCPEGHIMDFPVIEYIHKNTEFEQDNYDETKYTIRRLSGGNSASLSGISYYCEETKKIKNLGGITQNGALKGINFSNSISYGKCPGYRPWLGHNANEECNVDVEDLKVVQRGGTNIWFGETRSSIYIPPDISYSADRKILQVANAIRDKISNSLSNGQIDKKMVEAFASIYNVDSEELYNCLAQTVGEKANDVEESEDEYRFNEYQALTTSCGSDSHDLYVKNQSMDAYNELIRPYFKSVSFVYKVKETRALIGFSRLEPQIGKSVEDFKKQLTKEGKTNWVPAIQVSGEGIFIQFSEDAIKTWKQGAAIQANATRMRDNFNSSCFKQGAKISNLNPEYVLIHTFSHILINELSKKCGYGSSALRERLYVSKEGESKMFGVLIYTASGDSEGSLGGLVREATPGKLEDTLFNVLNEAQWCSADPFCISSNGQGPDSCNLGACHNCALLPETSCENGNRMLDRAMIIGPTTNPQEGYFYNLIKYINEH